MTLRIKAGKLRIPEKSIEQGIRTLLELNGWRVHKIDVMRGVCVRYAGKSGERVFSEGYKGQPDLIAVKMVRGLRKSPIASYPTWGDVLYIETKALDGRLSVSQQAVHEVLRREGYVVLVPRSIEEFEQQMRELGLPLRGKDGG